MLKRVKETMMKCFYDWFLFYISFHSYWDFLLKRFTCSQNNLKMTRLWRQPCLVNMHCLIILLYDVSERESKLDLDVPVKHGLLLTMRNSEFLGELHHWVCNSCTPEILCAMRHGTKLQIWIHKAYHALLFCNGWLSSRSCFVL